MPDNDTVSILLGVEELLFTLSVLNIQTLPGLGESPLTSLTEEQVNYALSAGYNSLRARGWVEENHTSDGKQIALESTLVALVSTCASASQVLLLTSQPSDHAPKATYIHFDPRLTVMHQLEAPGVHRMTGMVDGEVTLAQIKKELHLDQRASPAAKGLTISQKVLDALVASISNNETEESVSLLQAQGISLPIARSLTDSINNIVANTMVTMLSAPDRENEVPQLLGNFALIEGSQGFWRLTTIPSDDKENVQVNIEPVSAEDITAQIADLIRETHSDES